jgi:hypothetical protein
VTAKLIDWNTPPIGGPTSDDPLRGLERLRKVAVVGAKTIRELANAPVLYIWEDIAIAGIIVVLAGKVGCGKTTLLFWILVARMNTGEPVKVLDRTVTPAPAGMFVVLIEGEHSERSASRKLVKMATVAGIVDVDAALERVIVVARKSVRIGSPEWQNVETLIAAGLVSDIALDTLARVAPADANSESEQVAIFDRVATAIDRAPSEETKPVCWVAAHQRKGEEDDLDSISGSHQRPGQADTVLIVRAERRDGRVLSSTVIFPKLREEPDLYPGPIEYTVSKDSVIVIGASDDDDRPLEERIEEQLTLGPQTANRLATRLGRNDKDIQTAISALFAAHRITTTTVKVRGKPCRAFTVREGAA